MTTHVAPTGLADLLSHRARSSPDGVALRDLRNDLSERDAVTYAALETRALQIADALAATTAPGDRALLITPHPIDYLAGLFGCLFAGVTAVSGVPAYAPSTRSVRHAARLRRLHAVIGDCGATALIGPLDLLHRIDDTLRPLGRNVSLVSSEDRKDAPIVGLARPLAPDGLAMLQYTSGSTASPGGVRLRQDNLVANLAAQAERLAVDERDVGVSWLPLHHDLGLIGACLLAIYSGFPLIQLPAAGFLEQPRRWLQALSAFGGTISWAPNFAYKLCLRAVPPEDRDDLDLTCWRIALNAAEPVQADTVRSFAPGFRAAGLPPEAMYPAYGLAEATLLVTAPDPGAAPRIARLHKAALARDEVAATPAGDPRNAVEVVGCGRPLPGFALRIVDPATGVPVASDRVGEIWVTGPSVSDGYFAGAGQPRDGFHGRLTDDPTPWLRTGDLGFMMDEDLFVTGRRKDVIILRGANLYPQDLEATAAGSHPALRDDYACAFPALADGEEALVVACEIDRRDTDAAPMAATAIRRALFEDHGLETYAVVVIPFGAMPMTPSGKVQRKACAQAWAQGDLPVVFEHRLPLAPAQPGSALLAASAPVGETAVDWLLRRLAGFAPDTALTAATPLADLGLSSLQVTELAGDIEGRFAQRIPVAELFECRRVRDVAARLDQALTGPRRETGGATKAGLVNSGSG